MTTANILIIDDDITICETLANVIKRLGHKVSYALTLNEGLVINSTDYIDVVLLDVRLPDGNGLEAISTIREVDSMPEVIIITGEGDPDGAVLAIKNGAWDYIEKPFSLDKMTLPLLRAIQYREEKKNKSSVALMRGGIIGNSQQLKACLDLVANAANSNANVLITGETGTGKELFSSAIHLNSARKNMNFVVVDCAALPETLVESTLFGHIKGAFTGADKSRDGLIKQADGGTLFLDEVGEMPLPIQKTFLRVLQERSFRPVGGKHETKSDFRLIAATNKDLDDAVATNKFRQDLLYRLRSIAIDLPPLKERIDDIKALAIHFMMRFSSRKKKGTKGFSREFVDAICAYSWPGNVRELQNAIENAVVAASETPILFPHHLPMNIRAELVRASVEKRHSPKTPIQPDPQIKTLKEVRDTAIAEIEKRYLEKLMSHTKGDIKTACEISGLSRPRIYALLKKYAVSRFS